MGAGTCVRTAQSTCPHWRCTSHRWPSTSNGKTWISPIARWKRMLNPPHWLHLKQANRSIGIVRRSDRTRPLLSLFWTQSIMCCLKRINSTSSRSNPYSDRSFAPPLLLRAFLPKVSRLFHPFFSSCLIAHVSLRSHGFCVGRGVILSSIEGPRYITVAGEWAHRAVWNHWYMEPKRGYNLGQLWADHTTDIIQKVTSSREVTSDDIQRVAAVAASKPIAQLPESVFLRVLGTPEALRLFGPRLKQDHILKEQQKSMKGVSVRIKQIKVRLERRRLLKKMEEKCWWQ